MSNKKLLTVSAEFDLDKKPKWLDDFRKKYDKPFSYHVTFKTSTYFDEKDIEQIKFELSKIISHHHKIPVTFSRLLVSSSPKGMCIMIEAEENKKLTNLQKEISMTLARFGEHKTEQYKSFEVNFMPHITIGRELTLEEINQAVQELGADLNCEALIDNVVLTTVREDSFEEWSEQKNKIRYKLGRKEDREIERETDYGLKMK